MVVVIDSYTIIQLYVYVEDKYLWSSKSNHKAGDLYFKAE